MSKKDPTQKKKQISYYRNRALSMLNIFQIENGECFYTWLNKFEHVADMVEVPNNRIVEFFKTMMDDEVHRSVMKKLPSVKFNNLSYTEIISHYLRHFPHTYPRNLHRQRFMDRKQYQNESIEQYADKLQKIYNMCCSLYREESKLCEQFINGIYDEETRTYLSEYSEMSFDEIVEKAIAFEKSNITNSYRDQALTMINVYNPTKEGLFHVWLNKLEYVANKIEVPDDKMLAFYKKMVDKDVHAKVKETLSSVNLSELSYTDLINHYHSCFSSSTETNLHKSRLGCRIQYKKETTEEYINNLQKIYDMCGYASEEEEILCNQFIKGLRNEETRAYLSKLPSISYAELAAKAIEFETVNDISKYLKPALSMINIYQKKEGLFHTWLTKFENVAKVIKVPDYKMITFFKKMVDNNVHMKVEEEFSTVNLSELSYEKLINIYRLYFSVSNETYEHRKNLKCRIQHERETLKKYASNLKKIYDMCNYPSKKQEILCNQFIKGIRDEEIRAHLNEFRSTSFDEIVEEAIEFKKASAIISYQNQALSTINIYNPEKEGSFETWLTKFENKAKVIKVPGSKMVTFFKKMVDNNVRMRVEEVFSTVNFSELSYKEIITYYHRYFSVSNETTKHRLSLKCRIQNESETIEQYVIDLQKRYEMCYYPSEEEEICNQFIKGIHDEETRAYLREIPDISFPEIVEKAIAFERENDVTSYQNQALSMINIYNPEKEGSFQTWLPRFENVAKVIEVPDNKMVTFFKKMLHNNVRMNVEEVFSTVNFYKLSYTEIINHYTRYFTVSNETTKHRISLKCRIQNESETIEQYASNLQKRYEMCYYPSEEEEICNQFIKGIHDEETRAYLRDLPDISFPEIVEKAIAFERENDVTSYRNQALLTINIYNPFKEGPFDTWLTKFENVAKEIEVPDNKMITFFKKMIDNNVQMKVEEKFSSFNYSKLSYTEIIDHYRYYFYACNETIEYRKQLKCCTQSQTETIRNYASNLQKIYNMCDYASDEIEILCNQFIKGIRDEKTRAHLSKFPDISFSELIAKAIAFEKTNDQASYRSEALLKINIYNPLKEGLFTTWLTKFENVAKEIEVPKNEMFTFFKKMVDNNVHMKVEKEFPTVNFSKLSYTEIINYYNRYFSTFNVINENRKQLKCRKQSQIETIRNYASNLQKIYDMCDYASDEKEILCNQFIKGIRDEKTRAHLNKFPGISFSELVAKAIAFEKANDITSYQNQALSTINIYNPEKEGPFNEWLPKFENLAKVIKMPDYKMATFFKMMIDNSVQRKVEEKFNYYNFSKLLYTEIIDVYCRYFSDYNETIEHRKQLECRIQSETETIKKYAYMLKKIYDMCDYPSEEKEILCNQFIKGLRDEETKAHLGEFSGLSFPEIVAKAIAFEKSNDISFYRNQALSMMNIYNPENEGLFETWFIKFEKVAIEIEVPYNKILTFFKKMVDNNVHMKVEEKIPTVNSSKHSYTEIINYYHRYFYALNVINENRKQLECFTQSKDETTKIYADNLQRGYKTCNYASEEEEILCNQFIKGILDDDTRAYLREFPGKSFDEIVEKAVAFEKTYDVTAYRFKALLKINIYNPEKDGLFQTWLTKFENVAKVIKVPDCLMVTFFKKMVDNNVHIKIKKKYSSVNFSKLSYTEIIERYGHYFSALNEINEHREHLKVRIQLESETLEQYTMSLKKIYDKCDYASEEEEIICNQFIKGLRNEETRAHLSKSSGMSFSEICLKALEFEEVNDLSDYLKPALSMINIYQTEEGLFDTWLTKFENVAKVIKVPGSKMITFFKKMVDNNVHIKVEEEFSSVNFSELLHTEIIDIYRRYFSVSNETYERRKHLKIRIQHESETTEEYASSLQKIYDMCDYPSEEKEILCNQFFKGIRDEETISYLREFPGLSFPEIVAKAIAFEKANDVASFQNQALSKINIYNPEKEGLFISWLSKFENVANVIEVPYNKMVIFFKKMVDNNVHLKVEQKFSSVNFSELSYTEIIDHYRQYFSSLNETNEHREHLKVRIQLESETIKQYASNLQKIYDMCDYPSDEKEILCNQFIKGIRDEETRAHLGEFSGLSFPEIVAKAIAFEKDNDVTSVKNQALSKINIYNPEKEGLFETWLIKFENVAKEIEVPYNKMLTFFKKMVDNNVRMKVERKFSSVNFSELLYTEIINYYYFFFSDCKDINEHREHFKILVQSETETIHEFAFVSRELFFTCGYGSNDQEILCNQFIKGIRDEEIRAFVKDFGGTSFREIAHMADAFEQSKNFTSSRNQAYSTFVVKNLTKGKSFQEWFKDFETAATDVGVPESKMLKFFNRSIDDSLRRRVEEKFPSVKFSELSYSETVRYYFQYFSSLKKNFIHKNRFKCRKQFASETIEQYANNLKKIYDMCNYPSEKKEILCNQFINGIRDEETRAYLNEFRGKSFDEIVSKAIAFESVHNVSDYLQPALSMINIYRKEEGLFHAWLNKFEYVADLIEVPDYKMRVLFKKMVDKNVHRGVVKRFSSFKFLELSYEEIINHYLRYFSSSNETDVHRSRFMCRKQYEKESIEKYAKNLQKLRNMCEDKSNLEEELCKKFINGILDKDIRKFLRKMPGLSFDETVGAAIAFEKKINLNKEDTKS